MVARHVASGVVCHLVRRHDFAFLEDGLDPPARGAVASPDYPPCHNT